MAIFVALTPFASTVLIASLNCAIPASAVVQVHRPATTATGAPRTLARLDLACTLRSRVAAASVATTS